MSKPRYIWWPYVKSAIRLYPDRKKYLEDMDGIQITASLTGMPRSGGTSRKTEDCAMRQRLSDTVQREYDAVCAAIQATERYKNGRDRLEVVRMVLWDRTHTIAGAALTIPVDERAAKGWHSDFIRCVADKMGMLD